MAKDNIVIVGSGAGGTEVARVLSAKLDYARYNLILVSPRDYYFHYPAGLRMVATDDGHLEDSAIIPVSGILSGGKGTLKVGTVTSIQKSSTSGGGGSVTLDNGESVPFRYLVLATGNKWEGPLLFPADKSDLVSTVKQWRENLKNAQSYVLVGAGAVGLELAGELRDIYPTKKITLVHAGTLPLNEVYPEKFRVDVVRRWKARNIDLVLGDRIDEIPTASPIVIKTANGKTIETDIVIPTRGGKPNTDFISTLGPEVLDVSGYVKVTDTLQVEGHPDIFAVGDIISFNEQKQLAKVAGHAAAVVANIISLIQGKPAKKKYAGSSEMIAITNGKNGGAAYLGVLWGILLGDTLVASMKSKHLFVDKYRKTLGAPA